MMHSIIFVWYLPITFSAVHLFHVGLDIVNGISANMPPTACSIDLGDRKLIDLKFLDDENLVLLCTESSCKSIAISSPLASPSLHRGKPNHTKEKNTFAHACYSQRAHMHRRAFSNRQHQV
jgi:hypothetical protein